MIFEDTNVHALTWKTNNTSADIANVLADCIFVINQTDSMKVSIASNKAYGAALVSIDRPIPIVNGVPMQWLKVIWDIRPSSVAVQRNRLYELDAILVYPQASSPNVKVQNWYDGSTQTLVADGNFQIDRVVGTKPDGSNQYGWTSVGYKHPPLVQEVWSLLTNKYYFDYANKKSSVISTQMNDNPEFFITPLQNLPNNPSNWGMYINGVPQPLLHLQAQLCVDAVPAGFEVEYIVNLVWSDNIGFE